MWLFCLYFVYFAVVLFMLEAMLANVKLISSGQEKT